MSKRPVYGRFFLALGLFLFLFSCSDRTVGADTGADPIERPESGMWSECADQSDCGQLPYCVFPTDELGFCTRACTTEDECPASYAPPDNPICTPIGGGDVGCALDCSGGKGCPHGMRCTAVDTPDGARKLCF